MYAKREGEKRGILKNFGSDVNLVYVFAKNIDNRILTKDNNNNTNTVDVGVKNIPSSTIGDERRKK